MQNFVAVKTDRGRFIDLRSTRRTPYPSEIDHAWRQTVGNARVIVSHGPVPWGGQLVDDKWLTKTVSGTPQSVSFPTVTESRWLFVEANLNASTVSVKFMTSTAFPTHDLTGSKLIFRFPLSLWTMKTAYGSTTASKTFDTPPGLIAIPGWAPPRAS